MDEENAVREQARQSLFSVLGPKSNFSICYTHFVESIFVLNEVSSHAVLYACSIPFPSLSSSTPACTPLLASP